MRAFRYMALMVVCLLTSPGLAQQATPSAGILELHFTPIRYAQLAIWLESKDGDFLSTVRLTEAVALRGIGNRPGASEMNSGFRWPYGRREGALPIWATRRATANGAKQWKRVIFQNRVSEGMASKTSNDSSPDNYFCLAFDRSRATKDALDAVTCASPTTFSSDKGRFITEADVSAGYAEPYEQPGTHMARMRPLGLDSLYPPRRDVAYCGASCSEHADVAHFAEHAREVMPEIDAVTMATPVGGVPQQILYVLPSDLEPGDYRACLEINVEGDYNATFNDRTFPTPAMSPNCTGQLGWDYYAICYGYPYRGQPSVVYCNDFKIGDPDQQTFTTGTVASAGIWDSSDPSYGNLKSMEGMTDDPAHAPGSGADRLQLMDEGYRLELVVKPPLSCEQDQPPSAVRELTVSNYPNKLRADKWARVSFRAASDDQAVYRYELRVSTDPITDDVSFMAATPAKQATIEAAELIIPTGAKPGELITVDMGGLVQETHYYVAVRAMDGCAKLGPLVTAQTTTQQRKYATVTPCFVATAAWGSPMAKDVGVLRRLRDRHLQSNALGRELVLGYYTVGPALADAIREREGLRAAARVALAPAVALARWLDE